jgi:hypothetical protein
LSQLSERSEFCVSHSTSACGAGSMSYSSCMKGPGYSYTAAMLWLHANWPKFCPHGRFLCELASHIWTEPTPARRRPLSVDARQGVKSFRTNRLLCFYFIYHKFNDAVGSDYIAAIYKIFFLNLFIWFVRLLALRPLLASCASLG